MRNVHHSGGLTRDELQSGHRGATAVAIDDLEFFETLARARCLVMPPWVYFINKAGQLEKLTPVRYTPAYALDKPGILVAVMDRLPVLPQAGPPSRV